MVKSGVRELWDWPCVRVLLVIAQKELTYMLPLLSEHNVFGRRGEFHCEMYVISNSSLNWLYFLVYKITCPRNCIYWQNYCYQTGLGMSYKNVVVGLVIFQMQCYYSIYSEKNTCASMKSICLSLLFLVALLPSRILAQQKVISRPGPGVTKQNPC